jgi:hypothetical protein
MPHYTDLGFEQDLPGEVETKEVVFVYLPIGSVSVRGGSGCDKQEAREEYLINIEDALRVLEEARDKVLECDDSLVYTVYNL